MLLGRIRVAWKRVKNTASPRSPARVAAGHRGSQDTQSASGPFIMTGWLRGVHNNRESHMPRSVAAPPTKDWLTSEEAAELTGVHVKTLLRWGRTGSCGCPRPAKLGSKTLRWSRRSL